MRGAGCGRGRGLGRVVNLRHSLSVMELSSCFVRTAYLVSEVLEQLQLVSNTNQQKDALVMMPSMGSRVKPSCCVHKLTKLR